ncbi:magnesium chelatase subunit H [Methanoplanus limicola]|uniref:Cobaltochelatase CobN subunit n=1 Tax=Methanoplanus limicola DSM 2279 TaxID=937775 RepID=H1Z243_9EURY|nr:magnesium chelatase subunit H [Methanoplanus limicola]EHQ36388.1 cobaltochelatase CobN subunit [Methanoplanus limicola DSM 2279]
MIKITCISTVSSPSIIEAAHKIRKNFGIDIDFRLYYPHQIQNENIDEETVIRHLQSSDCVLLDIRGVGRANELAIKALRDKNSVCLNMMGPWSNLFEITRLGAMSGKEILAKSRANKEKSEPTVFKDDTARPPEKEKDENAPPEDRRKIMKDMLSESSGSLNREDIANYLQCIQYWREGGLENYSQMFILLLRRYLGQTGLPAPNPPLHHPDYAIFHPDLGYYTERDEYFAASGYNPEKPTLGIIFHGGMHLDQNIPSIKGLIGALPECNIIPVYANPENNIHSIEKYFMDGEKPLVDGIINLKWFRINGGPLGGNPEITQILLKKLNVPVFAPVSLFGQDVSEWEDSIAGISPVASIMSVIWPELDGCIEPIPICGLMPVEIEGEECSEIQVIPERIEKISGRILKWLRLKRLMNSEKKVAIIIYSYPPGEGNTGGASYLDTFVSVKRMLEKLKDNGYNVDIPEGKLHEIFEENCIVNSGSWFDISKTAENSFSWDLSSYLEYFNSFPPDVRDDVNEAWGTAPGNVMTLNDRFILPGMQYGNVLVAIQPARPPLTEDDVAKAAHDKTKPPHHQYIAFYRWLETVWGADLVFHVGTHGLAEFTKGKEIGMSSKCFPDILIGNMPHLYIYSVTNTSEATIAKRRLYGTMLSYNSPPFTTSDLYEKYIELEDLIAEHEEAERLSQEVRVKRTEEKIFEIAEELHFDLDSIHAIHEQVYEMKRSIIPQGLHTLGEMYKPEAYKHYIEFTIRYDRDGAKSLNRIIAESQKIPYDEAIRDKGNYATVLDSIDKKCSEIVSVLVEQGIDEAVVFSGTGEELHDDLRNTLNLGLTLAGDYADNGLELENCIRGLNTEFIAPRVGGDVIRKPEVLPTGGNLLQFDPTKIPTQTAFERGQEIAENTIQKYLNEEGKYPERVGTVLWGFETSNSGGETVGQILSYMGVRVTRKAGSWSPELKVVPMEELGRPRIDCHVSICGFFRDMFPNIMQMINKAVALVSALDESDEMNYVKKHSTENMQSLTEQLTEGLLDEKTAKKLSTARIYGPHGGEYGTRILGLMEDSVWKSEEDLAEVYMSSMSHIYTDNIHGQSQRALYENNVKSVEIVSQIRDRHDREIVDLDHYFEYFGGLNKAVETVSGKTPMLMISDTTKEAVYTEDVKDVIKRGTRTRLLNPKWIDEMLKHDYHGAQQIEERVYITLGFAATTHAVENWIWSSIAERFVYDEEMRKRLMENNRFAALGLTERLMEAEQRGYWEATEEELEKLRQAYMEMEGDIEERL